MRYRRTRRRDAFTLVEILVVIAIIVVLVGLTAGAVQRIRGTAGVVQTRSDIAQMESAIASAKSEMGDVGYIPSSIILREDNNYNMGNTAERASVAFLQKMFGRRLDMRPLGPGAPGQDWNGDGTVAAGAAGTYLLRGHECLVFFLGGIPTAPAQTPGCLGFSRNPAYPTAPLGSEPRYGPYFDFKSSRLQRSTQNNNFLYYLDPYGTNFYAYFSSKKSGNDYTQDIDITLTGPNVPAPYRLSATQFANPNGFQIMSAGADGIFGNPSLWSPDGGTTDPVGKDDVANFSRSVLASPQS